MFVLLAGCSDDSTCKGPDRVDQVPLPVGFPVLARCCMGRTSTAGTKLGTFWGPMRDILLPRRCMVPTLPGALLAAAYGMPIVCEERGMAPKTAYAMLDG